MTKYVIHGGQPLSGEIEISGAKNAAVAIIPAALLVDGVCRIENIPQISDVTLILNILQELGADVRTVNRTTVDVDCSHIRNARVPEELAITGFGNLPLCEKLRPQLTTADQQAETIGCTAARLLLERITGGETGPRREIRLPAQPVLRGSTGSRTVSLLHKPETAGERKNILRASC